MLVEGIRITSGIAGIWWNILSTFLPLMGCSCAVVHFKHFAAVLSFVKFSDPTNLWKIEGGGRDR